RSLSAFWDALCLQPERWEDELIESYSIASTRCPACSQQVWRCSKSKEIGIRTALGAQSRDIFRLALRETLLLAAIRGFIGLPLGMAASRLIASMLFGVKATDPVTIAIAILVMLATTVLAGYLPARRATKVDPMDALRRE